MSHQTDSTNHLLAGAVDGGQRGDGRAGRRAQAALGFATSACFCAAVVGSNLPGPLLPLYRDHLGLTAFAVAALFSTYFVGLIAMFLAMSRTHLGRRSDILLPVALLIGAAGDVALWSGADHVALLFAGRALTGICVGIATGAAATLAVVATGERGRTLAATGAILGSLLGLMASAIIAELLPQPMVLVYRLHAALLLVCCATLVAAQWRTRDLLEARLGQSAAPAEPTHPTGRPGSPRTTFAAYAIGAAGWTVGGIAAGVLPTAMSGGVAGASPIVSVLAALVLFVTAWLVPRLAGRWGWAATVPTILVEIGAGAVAIAAGLIADVLWPILVGSVLWGIGQGFAYAHGLLMLTRGLLPVEQGRRTSLYACTSYAFCAVVVLASGAIATGWGAVTGVIAICGLLVFWCALAAGAGRGRWAGRSPSGAA
ncbi:MFS transporter [Rhodococcus opacus]|uniref:MFS transporter n=1 Tax=Rhodococcus opacus TaxID=37919 RepID=UPI001C43A45F|nr:MFS transporter [Rhodococcus opacus]MBV6762831.1 MFS transporter [Rhodococcus opacus]